MLGHQDKYTIFGYKIPLYFWFVVSGIICDIIQAFIDFGIYLVYPIDYPERATVCWTLSYIISIVFRHYSHKMLVFGDYEGSYWSSLGRMYATYAASIILSMFTNKFLVNNFFFSHRTAWIVTMLWTGILNYFLLKSTWRSRTIESLPTTTARDED